VMQEAFFGVHRFVDFHANLQMPRATLAGRLRLLVEHRVLERSTREGSLRESYRLSAKGLDQYDYALALTRFGDRRLTGRAAPPLRLRHVCGGLLGAEPYCRACDARLKLADVRFSEEASAEPSVAFSRKSRASGDASAYLRGRQTSVARTLTAIGDRWTMLMIYELFRGPRRFEDFSRELGMAPNILADRLRYLTGAALIIGKPYQRPLRLMYRLTPVGKDLFEVILALVAWGSRWLRPAPRDRPRHSCGGAADLAYRCSHCGATVRPFEVTVETSSGATALGAAG
jgi:DNA-binding HxlR family transcriptional regulator